MTVMVPRRNVPAMVAVLAGCMAVMRMRQVMARPMLLPPPPPQWLTLDQAARYTGLSEGFLRRLIAARRLVAMNDGGPKVRRVDLDALEGLGSAVGELRKMRARR